MKNTEATSHFSSFSPTPDSLTCSIVCFLFFGLTDPFLHLVIVMAGILCQFPLCRSTYTLMAMTRRSSVVLGQECCRLVSSIPVPSTEYDFLKQCTLGHQDIHDKLPKHGWTSPETNQLLTSKLQLKKTLQKWQPILSSKSSGDSFFASSPPTATQTQRDSVLDVSPPIPQPEAFGSPKPSKRAREAPGLPSSDQLETIHRELSECLPKFFVSTHKFTLYTKDVIFEDHIRKVATKGINDYMINLSLLRIKGHLSYSSVALRVLKITKDEDEGTVKVRWQIRGLPGWRVIFTFWRYVPLAFVKNDSGLNNAGTAVWDGFSTFYVNDQGLIYRHLADKLMPDEEKITKTVEVNPLSKILSKTNLA